MTPAISAIGACHALAILAMTMTAVHGAEEASTGKPLAAASPAPGQRLVPRLPASGRLRLLIDTDAANEIDDLYAIALAIRTPGRFTIEGLVATHFLRGGKVDSRKTTEQSYAVIAELLAGEATLPALRIERGGELLRSLSEPSDSAGARFIIERAKAGTPEDPLWVVALGAASNVASALLLDPSIADRIRLVFHARSEQSWPVRSEQYNVKGDVLAARYLLESAVPLIWYDTGAQLTAPMAETERLLPLGGMPAFLHRYRMRHQYFRDANKGFFDLGDIAWLIDPSTCTQEEVDVPRMDQQLRFTQGHDLGRMLRVHSCTREPVWRLFYDRMGIPAGAGK